MNDIRFELLNLHIDSDVNQQLSDKDAFIIWYGDHVLSQVFHDAVRVPVSPLEQNQLIEQWGGVSASHASKIGDWQYYSNDQYLIAMVPNTLLENLPVDQGAESAYTMIFDQISRWGYPYLIRTWNYFPDITDGHSAQNNYQLFCSGRARAYQHTTITPSAYPAATVIGTSQPGLHIYFIAAKTNGIGIENTQQVSAYNYPTSYSQDPPLFSRALLHRNQQQEILFISGTASITGHSTQYADDVNRQLEVCISNIENLLSTAIAEYGFTSMTLQNCIHLKVFLRHADNLDTVRTHLQLHLGPTVPIYYFLGDMCRPDLSVEIEAVAASNL